MSTITADDLRARAEDLRDRADDARDDLRDRAGNVGDRAQEIGGRAGRAVRRARAQAEPRLRAWGEQAREAIEGVDTDHLKDEARHLAEEARRTSGQVGHHLMRIGVDVADATRHEADRMAAAVRESAAEARREARREAEEAARARRVRALLGWTIFGALAGAVLARRLGGGDQEGPFDEASPTQEDPDREIALDEADGAARPATPADTP